MPAIQCHLPACTFSTPDVDSAVAAVMLAHHLSSAHPAPAQRKAPTIPQPKVTASIYEDQWDSFTREWIVYKETVSMPADKIPVYLLSCCSQELKSSVERADPAITTKSEADVLAAIKRHAVISVAVSVLRTELLVMKQDHGENVLAFASRALGKARNCKLTVRCPHDANVDYSEEMVKQVVLAGMYDDDIKRKVLGTVGIDDKSLNETIAIIEMEEMASRSMTGISLPAQAGSTNFKKQISPNDSRLQLKGKCETCGADFPKHRIRRVSGKVDTLLTDRLCKPCWQKKRDSRRPKHSPTHENEASGSAKADDFPYLAAVHLGEESPSTEMLAADATKLKSHQSVPMPHHIFDGTRGWMQTPAEPHPVITLTVTTDESDYNHLRLPCPKMRPTKCSVVADSGCQSALIGLKMLHKFGLKKSCLVPVKGKMSAINGEGIEILGAVFLRLEGADHNTGQVVQAAVMAHVSESTDRFYISRQVMRELGIISRDFPQIQALDAHAAASAESATAPCGCPRHSLPPKRPDFLPFNPSEENVGKMKAWLLDYFASSTFNTCQHEPAPMMKTEPIRIHIDPDAVPKPAFTASTVPIHWREKVSEQIKEDLAKKVIERVEPGVPTVWQARMHVVAKPDGSPRRVIDFKHLNKHCKRETQHVVPPYKQARLVPAGGFRTVTDCKDGYHSCPLAEEDRHLTTFITEEGRFRYCVAPQGYLASGDGYNQRYDNIIADVPRKTKCVDDVIKWDDDDSIEEHWWRIIDYLILVGTNGITLNPKKFQFCQRDVEFAGFLITQDDVKPIPKYLDAIRNFPRPSNISDIRSWFGLVNQVSHYAKLTGMMAPFKPLLSPKTRFRWDDELEQAFQRSKLEIVKAIEEGVRIFEPGRTTCLSPDWSKTGIGYFLYQKYCTCPSKVTTCCENGWHIVLAGSRFLQKAERNYWPVEGEALAVVWGLEDTRFFTVGCADLHVQTDHRPLVKLLGDRTIDEIQNRRLINLKEKSMWWRFEIHHVPGRLIPAPDATSRSPHDRDSSTLEPEDWPSTSAALDAIRIVHDVDDMEMCVIAAARSSLPPMQAVTWERVRDETSCDIYLLQLIDMAEHGFPESPQLMSPQLLPYWRFRDDLSTVDGVLMYGLRAVIPPKLRDEVMVHLHSAHQGVSQMNNRASECVFWPGITSDIQAVRARCTTCNVNAPSQSKLPPADPYIPTAPFQAVASDYFQFQGKSYLLTVDRFSNWPDLREAAAHSANAGSEGLIKANRELFATFGVPEQLSSDGGPEYTSKAFQEFMRTWGVKHRLSSAYNPQSNGRAEVTVKSMKRLLRDNIDGNGKLNTDAVTRAILQIRNTPEGDSGLSPAQILLGRTLRDTLPLQPPIPRRTTVFDDDSVVSPVWKNVWSAKEHALKARLARQVEKLGDGSHELRPLQVGDTVRLQNQSGTHPKKWDKTGIVMQIGDNDQYIVRVDGSRRLTLRNRRFLRKMVPPNSTVYIPQPLQHRVSPPTICQSSQPNSLTDHVPRLCLEPELPQTTGQQLPLTNLPPPDAVQDPEPPTAQSVLPEDQPTQPEIQRPYLPIAPEQEDRQSSSHQTKRAAGRPPKKKIFNFSPCTPSVLSSQQPSVVVYPQLPTPSSTLPVDSGAPSPALAEPFTSNAAPQRPQRIKRKPDWYGDRE